LLLPESGEWAMNLRVSGKNLDIGEALRAHVQARIDSTISKYAAGPIIGHVTIEPEAKAHEPYASFNRAADRIERRVQRHKKRLADHHGVHGENLNAAEDNRPETIIGELSFAAIEETPLEVGAAIIAEQASSFKEMTVSGAVMELDLTNSSLVIFRHATDGRTNVVYRRPDGNIGWIDPRRA
jgi:ribosome-associated translation inhibitor RaiA